MLLLQRWRLRMMLLLLRLLPLLLLLLLPLLLLLLLVLLIILLLELIQCLHDRMQARVLDERVEERERDDQDAVRRDGQRAMRRGTCRTDRAAGLGGLRASQRADEK
jgi:hypothetical protein